MGPPRRRSDLRDYVHGSADADDLAELVERCDVVVDARGTFCPEPVIRTQNAAAELVPGAVLMLLADDGGVEIDVPAWCMSTGNAYLGVLREEGFLRCFVRRSERRPS